MRTILGFLIIFFGFQTLQAQYLKDEVYPFLKLPANARTTAFGGQQIAFYDADIQLVTNNPALLTDTLHKQFSFSSLFIPGGSQSGWLGYAHVFEKGFNGMAGIQFVNYGTFNETNEAQEDIGQFYAMDLALNVGASYQVKNWVFGANSKIISSFISNFQSTAIALDAGLVWQKNRTSFAATIKNLGTVINSYNNKETNEKLPFDLQLGFSQRLKYVPFRISVNAHDLHRWDIRYDDPNEQANSNIFGQEEETKEKSYFVDEFFRHFIFSGEMYLGKPLSIQLAYNHKRAKEMQYADEKSLSGFSFGVKIDTKKFDIVYGLGVLNKAGSYHHLSFTTQLGSFKKNTKEKN